MPENLHFTTATQYAWKAAADQVDPDGVADHMLPDQRARFEAALVRTIDERAVANRLAFRILRAEDIGRYADAVATTESSAEVIQHLHAFVSEVLGWPANSLSERIVVGITAARLIAAERAVRARAEAMPVPPLAVPSQLYAAYADLLSLHYGLSVRDRLLYALKSLFQSEPMAATHLGAMAVAVVNDEIGGSVYVHDTDTRRTTTWPRLAAPHVVELYRAAKARGEV